MKAAGLPMPVAEEVCAASAGFSERYRPGVLSTIFSFPVMLGVLLVLLSVFNVRERLNDPDTWWHLKTGEIIWQTHVIPTVDLFSYTTGHRAYIPHEWLSQLSIYVAYHAAGYAGIMAWLWVFTSLMSILGYALCWTYCGNPRIAFLGALGIWFFATVGLAARPQVIGYVLLICELIILELGRSRNSMWFFALPFLFAAWVNCHGSFALGLAAAALLLVCGFFDLQIGSLVSRKWSSRKLTTLAIAVGLSVAALGLNPVGMGQLLYPIFTIGGQQNLAMQYSLEWQPPVLNDIRTFALFGITGIVLAAPFVRRRELRLQELVIAIAAFYLTVRHQRMFFAFGILVMPTLCRLMATMWEAHEKSREKVLLNFVMILLAIFSIPFLFPTARDLNEQVTKANPVEAVQFLKRSGMSGRMLNEYVYGGYLIWTAPEHKVFVDGRSDVFEWSGVLGDYMDWVNFKSDPESILQKYRIDFCLLSKEEPISRVIPLLPGWKAVYADKRSIIVARSGK